MPSGIFGADLSFPTFKGNESADQKIVKVQNYLFMLLEQLRYALNNLDTSNWNTAALGDFIDEIRAGVVTANTVISNTVITNTLTAEKGYIAELTVDQIDTGGMVPAYLASSTAAVKYWRGYDQYIDFIEANVASPLTAVQVTDRNENPVYWIDADHVGTGITTDTTSYPVRRYVYDGPDGLGVVKLRIYHSTDPETGYACPIMEWGAGTGNAEHPNWGKAFTYKKADGYYTDYYAPTDGSLRRIVLGDDGIVLTPYDLEQIDFYSNGFSAKYSGQTFTYNWTKDGDGKITSLTTEDAVTIPVNWHAGDM